MISCEISEMNKLFVRIIRLSRDNEFQQLKVFTQARSNQMEKIMNPSIEKERTKEVAENIQNFSKYIDELEKSLANRDTSYNLLEELYSEIDNDNLGIRPEDIARAKKDGKLDKILKSPYK
jgi:signal recognition particle GTPase